MLSILMAAIFKFLSDHSDQLDQDELVDLHMLGRQLVLKDGNRLRVRPQIQNSNYDDYVNVLKDSGLIAKAPTVTFLRLRRIMKCYNHFSTLFEQHACPKLSVNPASRSFAASGRVVLRARRQRTSVSV